MATRQNLTAKKRRWERAFLSQLAVNGNVSSACNAAGVSRAVVYEHRTNDADFAKTWDEAIDEASERLEEEAWRRAVDGVDKPVYQSGQCVGTVREFSDTLLIFLLKGHKPRKYRDRSEITISHDDLSKLSDDELAAIARGGA